MPYKPQIKKLDFYKYTGVGTSLPGSGVDGEMFYDSDDNILYVWANNQWNAISGGSTPTPSFFLLESGDFLLLESGDKLILG